MKIAFLTGAVLFVGFSLFAQEKEGLQIIQEGTENSIEVSTEEPFEDSESRLWLLQIGSKNQMIIEQITYNSATTAVQFGSGNFLDLKGIYDENTQTDIEQLGVDNTLFLQSSNIDSKIYISQGFGTSEPGVGNYADIATSGTNHYIYLVQIGDENNVGVEQRVMSNGLSIIQKGSINNSLVHQFDMNSRLGIEQTGENNFSAIGQRGEGSITDLLQDGNGNFAVVNQNGLISEALLKQSGDYHSIIINQSVWEGKIMASQEGIGNYLEIEQEGILPEIAIEQEGEANRARINQSGVNHHVNFFSGIQIGSNNEIESMQNGEEGRVVITQYGSNNKALIVQE